MVGLLILPPPPPPHTRFRCSTSLSLNQNDREKRVAAAVEASRAERQSFQEEINKQRREIETKVADNLERLQVLYAPPKVPTGAAFTPTSGAPFFSASGAAGGGLPPPIPGVPATTTPRSAPEPERVNDEVEKLLALVRVTRNQI